MVNLLCITGFLSDYFFFFTTRSYSSLDIIVLSLELTGSQGELGYLQFISKKEGALPKDRTRITSCSPLSVAKPDGLRLLRVCRYSSLKRSQVDDTHCQVSLPSRDAPNSCPSSQHATTPSLVVGLLHFLAHHFSSPPLPSLPSFPPPLPPPHVFRLALGAGCPGMASILMSAAGLGVRFMTSPPGRPNQAQASSVKRAKRQHRTGS